MVNSGLKEYNDLNRAVKLCGGVSKYKSSLVNRGRVQGSALTALVIFGILGYAIYKELKIEEQEDLEESQELKRIDYVCCT